MPRRAIKARPVSEYRYMTTDHERAVDLCETSADTNGTHRVEPDVWPPVKKRGKVEDDYASFRCVLCGSWVLVYPDNDPEQSGVEIVLPKKEPVTTKK